MVQLYGATFTAKELHKRVGDISQIGGIRPILLNEGPGRGVAAAEFDTGIGFRFTVLLDRGMDISSASWQGRSLCWRSPTGECAPACFEPEGFEWLRIFFGGLLTTCGPTYFGAPCQDEGENLGLHGRWTTMAASKIQYDEHWAGDDYLMSVTGHMREARVFGWNLHIVRKIWTKLGERRLFIEDTLTNHADKPTPLMLLYHCNIGWPFLDENSRLLTPIRGQVEPVDEFAAQGLKDFSSFHAPVPGIRERCYYHPVIPDKAGHCRAALMNPRLDGGAGVYLRYPYKALPTFTEWKMMGAGTYVVGLEPGSCRLESRDQARAHKRLQMLAPGASKKFQLELGVLAGSAELKAFQQAMLTAVS